MRATLLTFLAILGLGLIQTQAAAIRQSQEFVAVDSRPSTESYPGALTSPSGEPLVKLDADVLLLSAERIRAALEGELELVQDRPGKIHLVLYPASKGDELIRLVSVLSPDGWSYEVEVPDQVERYKLVRGVVDAVLLEFANRRQGPKSAELPLWLTEGLAAQIWAAEGPDLVIQAVPLGSMLRVVRERKGLDYLKRTREILASHDRLTFADLSYPKPELLTPERLPVYQSSAHLFVYELLHQKDGPAQMLRFLRDLPRCWNWETALLDAFHNQFHTGLDVEKQWAVSLLVFTARNPSQVWSALASLDKLNQLLKVPAQVRVLSNAVPERTALSLQQVLTNWTFAAQAPVLQQKVALLAALRFNAAPELVPLIDSYQRTLRVYLLKRSQADRTPENRMQPVFSAVLVTEDAVRELQQLDKRRKEFQPEQTLSVNSPTSR